jgi:hypothetical protein
MRINEIINSGVQGVAEGSFEDRGKEHFLKNQNKAEWEQEKRAERHHQETESGVWYIRINGRIFKDRASGKPAQFNGKKHAQAVANKFIAQSFNDGKKIMLTTSPEDRPDEYK